MLTPLFRVALRESGVYLDLYPYASPHAVSIALGKL
jgi:hypothetical protein